MSISFYPDSSEIVEVVLCCDVDISNNNTKEALAAYRKSGDLHSIVVPGAASRFKLRPLTASQRAKATRAAGRSSLRGRDLYLQLSADALERIKKAAKVVAKAANATSEGTAPAEAHPEDALSDDDLHELHIFTDWVDRWSREYANAALSGLNGGFNLEAVRPKELQDEVVNELFDHAKRISTLSPGGKAVSV